MSNTSKNVATITIAIAVAALLVSSVLTMYTAEAKSKHGKIKVDLISPDDHGKGTLKIINERTGKVIVKADLNFAKLAKNSHGESCCHKTYEFNWKGNHVGDELTLRVKSNGITNEAVGNLESGTTHLGIDLNNDDD